MEFINRKATELGKVKLIRENGEVESCRIVLDDAATVEGTPLTAETFKQLETDIMDKIANCTVGEKGEKGDKGDKGEKGDPGSGATDLTGYATETFVETAINNAVTSALKNNY